MAKKNFKDYTAFGNISASLVLKNLPYVLFLGLLAMVYIANAHYSEKKIRQIQKLQSEVKELRWEYMSIKSELMYNSKRSEVVKQVEPLNLGLQRRLPKKIVVPEARYQ